MQTTLFILVATGTLAFAGGCSSGGNDNNPTGTGGTTGTAGGASGGDGGAAGSTQGCTASNTMTAPIDGLIDDFMNDSAGPDGGGLQLVKRIVTYANEGLASAGSPTYSTDGGTLTIMESAPAINEPQYVGLVAGFKDCIDASAFTGVQFTISGSFSGCTMLYATGDSEHDPAGGPPHGSGPAGAYAPQAPLTTAQVTSTPTVVSIPFAGSGAPSGGSPDGLSLDPAKLDSVLWQFNIPAAAAGDGGSSICRASVTIDNVKFYRQP